MLKKSSFNCLCKRLNVNIKSVLEVNIGLSKRSNVSKLTDGLAVPDEVQFTIFASVAKPILKDGCIGDGWRGQTTSLRREAGNGNAAQEMPSRWSDEWDTSFKVTRQRTDHPSNNTCCVPIFLYFSHLPRDSQWIQRDLLLILELYLFRLICS